MAVKQYKPTSPGRRGMTGFTFDEITKKRPEKSLLAPLKSKAGRNNQGRITVRHRGGGAKRRLRIIDFKRDKTGVPGRVAGIEYDPNRTARIALIYYRDGDKRYILAPVGLKVNDMIEAGPNAEIRPGNALPLSNIPTGTAIHNIELHPGRGGQIVRSAGSTAQLMAKEGDFALVRLPSGELRRVPDRLHRHHRPGQQRRKQHGQARQGRPLPLEGQPPHSPRLRHEPARPSARRRRRQGAHRHARAQDALGQARPRLPHPAPHRWRQVHRQKQAQRLGARQCHVRRKRDPTLSPG